MTVFGPIVGVPAHLAPLLVPELTHGCRVGTQSVSDDGFGSAVALQRLLDEGEGSLLIATEI